MLTLFPLDKEKNEESKVEDNLSPVFFLQLVFSVSIFMKLEEKQFSVS